MKKNIFVLLAALCAVNGMFAVDFTNHSNNVIGVKKAGRYNSFHTIKSGGTESFPLGLGDVLFVRVGAITLQYNLQNAKKAYRSFTNANFNNQREVTLSGISSVNPNRDAALRSAGYTVSRSQKDQEVLHISIPGVRTETVY